MRSRVLVAIVTAATYAGLCGVGPAQTVPTAPPSAHELFPADAPAAIARLAAHYRRADTAERVTISITRADSPARTTPISVWLRPGSAADRSDRALRLELGDLLVCASKGQIQVARQSDPTTYAAWPYDAPLTSATLARVLPPIAVPQLALAFDDETNKLTPFSTVPAWELAAPAPSPDAKDAKVTLRGTDQTTETTLLMDAMTDRLVGFSLKRATPPSLVMDATCTPIKATSGPSWSIPIEGRRRVGSLAELRPRESELKPGDRLSDAAFQTCDQSPWVPQNAAPAGKPAVGVLVLFRPPPDGADTIPDDAAGALAASLRAWETATLARAENTVEAAASPKPAYVRGAAVFDLEKFTRERRDRVCAAWAKGLGALPALKVTAPPDAGALLWAPTDAGSLARVAPDARTVVVVLTEDAAIRAIVRADGRGADLPALTSEIVKAMSGLGVPPAPAK